MVLKCIVVDDEPLARGLLTDYIGKIPYLELVAACGDAFEAANVLREKEVDLIFIDIQMPGLTGLQFIQSLATKAMVIVITAYKKFAHEGFELDVVDYLVKPVGLDRFMKACNKAAELYRLRHTAPAAVPAEFMFLNVDYSLVKVQFSDIHWIEGSGDYVKIHLKNSTLPLLVRISTRAMEAELPPGRFLRIHKSYIVPVSGITSVRKSSVFLGELELPVGETYRDVIGQLTGKNG